MKEELKKKLIWFAIIVAATIVLTAAQAIYMIELR